MMKNTFYFMQKDLFVFNYILYYALSFASGIIMTSSYALHKLGAIFFANNSKTNES